MRVLHICPYMHPKAGGPPVVVERLASHADHFGWRAGVITTSLFCEDDGRALELKLRERIHIDVLKCDQTRLSGLASTAPAAIEAGVRDSHIIHLHTLWHPLNTLARLACARFKRKYVLMPHGMLDPYSLGVRAVRKRLYLALRERHNLAGASRLIFTTPMEEQLARSSLSWLDRAEVIPLGADQPPALSREQLAAAFHVQIPATSGRRCLVFLGRLHQKKGLEFILAALPNLVAAVPELLLVVAGTGDAAYVENLKMKVVRRELSRHVVFTGMLLGDLKWGALATAELFLLPSRQENFAIAVAEAMHMGVPVVVSDKVNTWPFVLQAGAGVVLDEECVSRELDRVILRLLGDPRTLRRMGARGQEFARQHFRWEKTAERTFALYDRLLGESTFSSEATETR